MEQGMYSARDAAQTKAATEIFTRRMNQLLPLRQSMAECISSCNTYALPVALYPAVAGAIHRKLWQQGAKPRTAPLQAVKGGSLLALWQGYSLFLVSSRRRETPEQKWRTTLTIGAAANSTGGLGGWRGRLRKCSRLLTVSR